MIDAPQGSTRSSLTARAFEQRPVVISASDGTQEDDAWGVAVEAPVEVALNGIAWTVMLATPADVEDLAVGLAITERVLRDARVVQQVEVSEFLRDIRVNLVVPEDALDRRVLRSRSLLSSTACGLCGLESLADLHGRSGARDVVSIVPIREAAILRAFDSLPSRQPINRVTRSVHAAAWCSPDGDLLLVREDVGRHNALDKLIGALARSERLDEPGFVVMSSRCSYELVYKAAAANTQLLATISAPTSMALEWSQALSVPLACCVGRETAVRVVRFPIRDSEASDAG